MIRYVVHMGELRVRLWAKATKRSVGGGGGEGGGGASAESVRVTLDVTDESVGGVWVGSAQPFYFGPGWSEHVVSVVLDPSRALHVFSLALIIGGTAAEYWARLGD